MPKKVITHDRIFHADDVIAVSILRIIDPACELIRTRDKETLQNAAGAPDTFLLDVGGRYDPELRLFDHHQTEGAGFRNMDELTWPYATAGLVWKHYGLEAVLALHPTLSIEGAKEVQDYIDEYIIKQVDAVDCGVRLKSSGPTISAIIAAFNPSYTEGDEFPFELVMNLAQVVLSNFIKRHAGKVLAREYVRQAPTELDGHVLILNTCLPWSDVVSKERPEVLLVVYPVGPPEKRVWQLRCAQDQEGEPRIKLPAKWGGLERHAFVETCGERDAEFCHRALHLAGAKSCEGIMNLARSALRNHMSEEATALKAA